MYFKIYLDTAPIIYFLENNPMYALKVQNFILGNATAGSFFAASVITDIEYLPKPMRESKTDLVNAYQKFKQILGIEILEVSQSISNIAVRLRTKYPGIKSLDSIHLASAIYANCDAFLTNDSQLRQVKEINVIYLDSLT